jgi:outer membrane biosynthesis protein TonB
MKYAFPVSVIAHVLVGASGMLAWNSALPASTEMYVDVPLDIVSLASETNIREVVRTKPQPEPEPEAEDLTAEEGAEEAPPPEPKAEVVPDEPAPEAVPPLEAPEAKPEKPPEVKEEPKKKVEEKKPEKPPIVQKRSEAEVKKGELDDLFSDAEDLLKNIDTKPKKQTQRTSSEELKDQEEKARRGSGDRTGMQVNVIDFVKAHIIQSECKRSIKDLPGWENLDVTVTFRLDSRGWITRAPKVTKSSRPVIGDRYMTSAANSALRAVSQCEPYPLPEEDYDLWKNKDITLTFDETF